MAVPLLLLALYVQVYVQHENSEGFSSGTMIISGTHEDLLAELEARSLERKVVSPSSDQFPKRADGVLLLQEKEEYSPPFHWLRSMLLYFYESGRR